MTSAKRSYLIIEEGLFIDNVTTVDRPISIGRDPHCDLFVADPQASRHHAIVSRKEGEDFLEDSGSRNGTYVNNHRIEKARLSNGDQIQIGDVIIHYLEREVLRDRSPVSETLELIQSDISGILRDNDRSRRCTRLMEEISKVSIFASLDAENLMQVSTSGRIVVFSPDSTIIRQGDPGKSIYIILEGKARSFVLGRQGEEVTLAVLSQGQFFGELSLLTEAPCPATVKAVDETVALRLSLELMLDLMQSKPAIKTALEDYYQEQLETIKSTIGFVEQRKQPRFNARIPLSFSVASRSPVTIGCQGKTWRLVSTDITISGTRAMLNDHDLHDLPLGCELDLEISLPSPWGALRCRGILRSKAGIQDDRRSIVLGVEFSSIKPDQQKKIEHFLDALINIKDITNHAKLIEQQFIRSQQLTPLGLLVSGVVHEIKNLNNCITFNIPIMIEYLQKLMPIIDNFAEGKEDFNPFGLPYLEFREDIFKLLNSVEYASKGIDRNASEVRDFVKRSADEVFHFVDIDKTIGTAEAICRLQLDRMIRSFETDVAGDLPMILTKAGALEQVLVNLLLNAVEAADKEDSRILVRATKGEVPPESICIEVIDNGCGMDKETKRHIFDAFFTTKDQEKGTGMGLFVSKRLMEELGGRIEVESTLNKGSVFRIILPSAERGMGGPGARSVQEPDPRSG
jgi:signal transduction histidine kinase/CRP-like cAMP-binding protein